MTFKVRSLSILVLGLGLTGASFAQDSKTTTPDPAAKAAARADRHAGKRGDFGGRKLGRHGVGGDFGRSGGRMDRFGGFGRGITLTDDQKAQIKQIREANKPDPATFQELRTIMEARRSGTLTDTQKARVKELRQQQAAKAKSVHEQMQNVLTAEQKAQIQKNVEERKARRDQMQERFKEWRKNRQTRPDAKTAPAKPITK